MNISIRLALVLLLFLLGACGPRPTGGSGAAATPPASASGLERLDQGQWAVDYPASWMFYPMAGFVTSFYDVSGYLASTPVDTSRICQTTKDSQTCDARGYDLPPGNVVITVGHGGVPMSDPIAFYEHPSVGTPTRVAGMAAIFSEDTIGPDRRLLTWEIASPSAFGNWVQLDAEIRGPGQAELRRQVEDLVASMRFEPQPVPISDDPLVARSIAHDALAQLKEDAAYACFPDEAGTSRNTMIREMPNGPPLNGEVPVTCSAEIHPTTIGFWQLELAISWEALGSRSSGTRHITQWLTPDGELSASTSDGETPAN